MPLMIYALLDTCILVRIWTQGKPGCEIEHLRELVDLVDKKVVRILLPEVVELETEKH
jgi:hypothetical protein